MTHKALTVSLLSFGLLLTALVARNGALALMALPFLAYLGAGLLAAPSLEETRLRATRSLRTIPGGEHTTVEVCVNVRNEGSGTVPLWLTDSLPQGIKVTKGDPNSWVTLAAGEETELQYAFQAERGNLHWQTVRAAVSDPFALFESRLELPAGAELLIQPRFRRFQSILLRPESTLHSPGSVPARLGGSGTDFLGIREYHPGDSLRRLDWRLTARHPRQLFTREFEQEEVADVGLILDARQRTNVQVGDDSLFEHTLAATASLAESFLHQGHRVSLLVFGDQIATVFPGYGKVQLNRILRILATTRLRPNDSHISLAYAPLRMFSTRALIVILSPLTPDDWTLFLRLRARGNQGLVICPDPIAFALQSFDQARAWQLGVRAARVERRLELRKIAQLHIRVIDWQVDRLLSPLVRDAFRPPRGQRE